MPKGSRVLMADDDKMLIDMYKERLELAGYTVTLCRNGEEALSKIREAKPDIILLDIMMPKVNGYEALASIKSDPATKDIPVIMLSALMRDFNREKAVEAGADDYLIKSEAMPADVITKIEQVLAKYNKSTVPNSCETSTNIPSPSVILPVGQNPSTPSISPAPATPTPAVAVNNLDALAASKDISSSDQNKIVFTSTNSEKPKDELETGKKSEKIEIKQSNSPVSIFPWEKDPPVVDLTKADKKKKSPASIALMVVIAILLTTLVNDLVIYFFFFTNK